jgi:cytoskeletal protein RodZ
MAGDNPDEAAGQGPGAELAYERERQGLTREQVAEQLNLDVSVIHWIENDDYAALGAPVFARGHLRRYSMLLGLPAERLLAAYARTGTHPSQPSLIPKAREELVPPRPPPRWPWVLGGLVGALLLAAFFDFVVERWTERAPPDAPPVATTPAPVATQPAATPTADGESTEAPAAAQTAAQTPGETAARPGQLTLKLTFGKDTWVEVYDGSGTPVLYDLGGGGTERTVRATAPISVTIGDPASVAVYVNGRRLAVPAAPAGHSLTRFSIDASGAVR